MKPVSVSVSQDPYIIGKVSTRLFRNLTACPHISRLYFCLFQPFIYYSFQWGIPNLCLTPRSCLCSRVASRFSEPITDVSIFLSATPFTQREASMSHNFPVLLVSFCQPHLSIETPSLCPETSTFLLNFPWFCCRRQVAENLDTSSQSATLYLASWSLKNPPIWTKKTY